MRLLGVLVDRFRFALARLLVAAAELVAPEDVQDERERQ